MKTRLLWLVLVAAPALWLVSSCHKSDHASPASKLVGEWHGTKIIAFYYSNNQLIESDTAAVESPDYITFKFNSDSTVDVSESINGSVESATNYYSVTGDEIVFRESPDDSNTASEKYTIKGKQMEIVTTTSASDPNNNVIREELHIFLTKQ